MPLVDRMEPPEWPEPQIFCDSCWYCVDIQNSRFDMVMYCHYHEEPYEDYEICDDYVEAGVMERLKHKQMMARKQEGR